MTGLLWGYQTIVKRDLFATDAVVRIRASVVTPVLSNPSAGTCSKVTTLFLAGAVLAGCAILAGCAGADVAVENTRLPVPVVNPLPVSLGIHLSDELRTYVHEEAIRDSGSYRINVGSAQELMFNNLATGLFRGHRFVATAADHAADIDAILVPTINELQFSIPKQTKSDFFEVWLKYNFELFGPDGTTIAEWPMQAYGRANSRNYGFLEDTDNGALQEASRVALRDAMALFTFKFQRVPEVQQWLSDRAGPEKVRETARETVAESVIESAQESVVNSAPSPQEVKQP